MYSTNLAGRLEKVVAGIFAYLAYRKKGYGFKRFLLFFSSRVITFVAKKDGKIAGTISVIHDGPAGLDLEKIYPEEVLKIRTSGVIAEIGFLACFTQTQKKTCDIKLLLSLYGEVYAYAMKKGIDVYCIAVNPAHEKFYRDVLLFEELGPKILYEKVGAEAIAEYLDLRSWPARIAEKKAKFAEKVYLHAYT